MRYSLLCFDMDGVIFSSGKILGPVYQSAISAYARDNQRDIAVPELSRILEEIGKPVPVIFANLFPELPDEERGKISSNVLHFLMQKVRNQEGELLEGVHEVLAFLNRHKIKVGLASNGRAGYLNSILETYDLADKFDSVAIIDHDKLPSKGSLVRHYMDEFSIPSEKTLMVGDRLTDYEAARENNVDFALVTSGHGNDFTDEPDVKVEWKIQSLPELIPVIEG